MIEALQQVTESVRKESTLGTSVKIGELQKEVRALGAESAGHMSASILWSRVPPLQILRRKPLLR